MILIFKITLCLENWTKNESGPLKMVYIYDISGFKYNPHSFYCCCLTKQNKNTKNKKLETQATFFFVHINILSYFKHELRNMT